MGTRPLAVVSYEPCTSELAEKKVLSYYIYNVLVALYSKFIVGAAAMEILWKGFNNYTALRRLVLHVINADSAD